MEQTFLIHSGRELGLSNLGQLELLRGAIERGATFRTRVRGVSMTPFIKDQDVLTIAPVNGNAPALGEVVAFSLPGTERLAIHRIVAIMNGGWQMRGDSSLQADGIISCEDILGRVTRVERAGKVIRLGMGSERRTIAWLSRNGLIARVKAFFSLLRQAVSSIASGLQSFSLYRSIGVRVRPSITVVEADDQCLAKALSCFKYECLTDSSGCDPRVTNYVAMRGSKVVGFVQYVRHPDKNFPWTGQWLFSLTVAAVYRGMGFGEMLTQHVIKRAITDGASELLLAVFEDNARAISLYRKLGFEQTVLPALELEFEAEERQRGKRRIVMRKSIAGQPHDRSESASVETDFR